MSEATDAFEEALDGAAEVRGVREKVHLRTVDIDALIFEEKLDMIPVGSGLASAEPIRVSVRRPDAPLPSGAVATPGLPIVFLEPITVRGLSLKILDHSILAGRLSLTCGDPSEEGTE